MYKRREKRVTGLRQSNGGGCELCECFFIFPSLLSQSQQHPSPNILHSSGQFPFALHFSFLYWTNSNWGQCYSSQVSQWKCFSLIESSRFSLTHNKKKGFAQLPWKWGFLLPKRRKWNNNGCSVRYASLLFVRLVAGVMLVVSVSSASTCKPSCESHLSAKG